MTDKLAIIGCGAVSEMFHIPAALELLGSENVVLVDNNTSRLKKTASKFGILSTAPNLQYIKSSLDAVVIATPPHTHPSIAEEAFELGFNVLCEKPLANSTAECSEIIQIAQSNRKMLAVCHTYRFFPSRLRLREMILSGELGKIEHIDIQQGGPASWDTRTGYSFQKELVPGGVLLIEGLHTVDSLLWCFGKPKAIHYIDDSMGGLESNVFLKMDFEDSCHASFRISRTCSLDNKIKVYGAKSTVELNIYDMNALQIDSNGKKRTIISGSGKDNFHTIAIAQLSDFISSIKENKKPACDGAEGTSVIEFIENCYSQKKERPLPTKAPVPGWMW